MTTSELERRLLEFDGKAISVLSEARAARRTDANFLDELATFSFDARSAISDGATWILKAELESGTKLPPKVLARIVGSLDKIRSWQAALHLCQSVEMFELSPKQAKPFLKWARTYANHARPFLRAWSCHARVMIGHKFPDMRNEVALALQSAEADDAASVQARARQLRKSLKL